MTENRGTRADLPPEGGLDTPKYVADETELVLPDVEPEPINVADLDLAYTGEGGDGQEERVPPGIS